jgi:MFS family permease
LWLGVGGLSGGGILLCLAPAPWASLLSCFLIGIFGGLLPAIVPAVPSQVSGVRYQVSDEAERTRLIPDP